MILGTTMMTTNSNFRNKKLRDVALFFFCTVSLLTSNLANAQIICATCDSAQTISNKLEIGFNMSQYQKDFGVGIHFISPYFIKKNVAIRAGTNIQWLENFNGTETTVTTYQNIQLGIRGRRVMVTHNISIYGEGGSFIILPNSDFSSQGSVFGGYGLFGFEFKIVPRFGYFIELGGVSTGATAD
jgi:hypothetical protein